MAYLPVSHPLQSPTGQGELLRPGVARCGSAWHQPSHFFMNGNKESPEFEARLNHIVSAMPAWTTCDPAPIPPKKSRDEE